MNENQYFPDLTAYTHQISPFVLNGVYNIGWLKPQFLVQSNSVPSNFDEKLIEIASAKGSFNGVVEPIRELPCCDVCGAIELKTTEGKILPNSELWIPGKTKIYAAPISIMHLIGNHGYCPPQEYIETVLAWHNDLEFDGNAVYRKKLQESDWFSARKPI